ncbi:MFS transporter [Streptomyces sp. NBC_00102]|uniref:MFS transporter n=1 Tax=Streptomyces sp. NBC_00102 TaxID=2975652 RepID=UPI0022506CB7|nr:MFS transporter [Streptomyces sp. NBC_00102]MCX5402048.1 MFS transporter [Streptomyces sp. NBC_00102]
MLTRFADTFRSLAVRNFRLFTLGQVFSAAGTWMMVVAQDWLVLGLTGDSATALGTVTALQFTPLLLLTLYGGRLADRYDKRMLLTVSNLASGACALALAVLVLSGTVRLWHIFLFALCLGTVNSVEVPTRMAFVGEMVGPGLLPNASALSAAYFNIARVLGPALAGLAIAAWGPGPVMALNAASYLATVVGLRRMRTSELRLAGRSGRGRVADGLRYVSSRPDLVRPMTLVLFVALFGLNFQLTLPLLARTVFHTDAASFGLLTAAFAAGSLMAALATTARRERPSARTVTVSALAFGVFETATGWAPTFGAAVLLLALTGFASIWFSQAANHRIQLGSDPRYRGRVLALYTLVLQGSTPLGAVLVGWLSLHWGGRSGLYMGGLASVGATVAVHFMGRADRPETGSPVPVHPYPLPADSALNGEADDRPAP